MSNIDEAKGRAKRAAGELTDDEKLKREPPGTHPIRTRRRHPRHPIPTRDGPPQICN
jgi:hypothetical protein